MSELPTIRYRPAVRSLAFGLVALGMRLAVLGVILLIMARQQAEDDYDASTALWAVPIIGLAAEVLALVAIGYGAIAAHRREWSVTLVFAWVVAVSAAIFQVDPFAFVLT